MAANQTNIVFRHPNAMVFTHALNSIKMENMLKPKYYIYK